MIFCFNYIFKSFDFQADLVHLGAKYSPCMRRDHNIYEAIELDKKIERETGCCIRNDRGGCVQASREDCSVCRVNLFILFNI